eukprot:Polyplicarium_translucidae@DN2402_c1_g1_i4.p2
MRSGAGCARANSAYCRGCRSIWDKALLLLSACGLPIFLNSADNAILKCNSKWLCDGTGAVLLPDQVRKCIPYGGRRVFIDPKERSQCSNFPGVGFGLRLFGFKPRSALDVSLSVKHPCFVYPNESGPLGITGSSKLMSALVEKMHEKQQVAIVLLVNRENAQPRFAALVPQVEEQTASGQQRHPAGLHLLPLPFAEDVRDLDLSTSTPHDADADKAVAETMEGVAAGRRVLHALLDESFRPGSWHNPTLQQHFATLEALALDMPEVAEVKDELIAPVVDGATGPAAEFAALFLEGGSPSPGRPAASRKRKADGPPATDDESIASMLEASRLDKLTVEQLKSWLRGKSLSTTGRKADLISRVGEHFAAGR